MRVQLTRRLADVLDGVDLSHHCVGDVIDVTRHEAELLIAEGWAVQQVSRPRQVKIGKAVPFVRAHAADQRPRRVLTTKQLRDIREQMHQHSLDVQEHRRAEDRIRDELHDERAHTISASGVTSSASAKGTTESG